jgi:hypothetical protein
MMQACTESGHFFTVGIYFQDKFFLEIQFLCSKKIHVVMSFISNSNGTRVFTIASLKSPDFTGISKQLILQMPDGKGLQML